MMSFCLTFAWIGLTWVEMGWPGSVHTNRVCANSEIYLGTDKYFDQKEYLLGDEAQPSLHIHLRGALGYRSADRSDDVVRLIARPACKRV